MIDGIATLTIVASTMIIATPSVSATRPSQRLRPETALSNFPCPRWVRRTTRRAARPCRSGRDRGDRWGACRSSSPGCHWEPVRVLARLWRGASHDDSFSSGTPRITASRRAPATARGRLGDPPATLQAPVQAVSACDGGRAPSPLTLPGPQAGSGPPRRGVPTLDRALVEEDPGALHHLDAPLRAAGLRDRGLRADGVRPRVALRLVRVAGDEFDARGGGRRIPWAHVAEIRLA